MEGKRLTKAQVLIMAIAAGSSAANIYYNQPILKDIGVSLGVNETKAGSISMLTQVGYGLGLFFLVPLGDKLNKKTMIIALLSGLSIVLVLMTRSQTIGQVWALSVCIGVIAVSSQVILPMAASIDRETTGKTIGQIFTGILVGVLAARVFSGFIAEWFGWRYVFGFSAALMIVIAILIKCTLPDVQAQFTGHYLNLLRSTIYQVKRFPALRRASVTGGLVFGVFCSFWTTLTFHLSGAPFFYHTDRIGLFGLVAIAGALMAPLFGKMADKGNARRSLLIGGMALIISLLVLKIFALSLVALVVAVLLLDMAVQAVQVTNIAIIYSLDKHSNSRINTVYMTSYFIGGALGSLAGILSWNYGGWSLVTWQMIAWSVLAFIIIFQGRYSKAQPVSTK